jgi:ABC-type iron transport system FetAB permease component
MKRILLFLLGHSLALAATTMNLEQLKREFPGHVAGLVTTKSNPAVVQCWNRYHDMVMGLQLDGLPLQIQRIKDQVAQEIREIEQRLSSRGNRIESTRAAEAQNRDWLKLKMVPYIKKIEQAQRGR